MEIERAGQQPTRQGPAEWFTGQVWMDPIAEPRPPARMAAVRVQFAPGARTAWHTHPYGQVLHVLTGAGRAQRRGGPVEEIRAGDTIRFEPGEDHWHGAAPDRFMVHLAMQEAGEDGKTTHWAAHVTDQEYGG